MLVYTLYDVERIFGVTFTDEQKAALRDIPFPEDVLKACAGTHMLFPSLPLSLLDVRAKHFELFYAKIVCWYAEEQHTFSRTPVPVRWHLLRTGPVPESLGKNWEEQCKLLLSDEEVPSAALIAFATMLHFGATRRRLFEHCYVRTSDVDSDGNRVFVGYFDAGGFDVYDDWDGNRHDYLGLSSARKF